MLVSYASRGSREGGGGRRFSGFENDNYRTLSGCVSFRAGCGANARAELALAAWRESRARACAVLVGADRAGPETPAALLTTLPGVIDERRLPAV